MQKLAEQGEYQAIAKFTAPYIDRAYPLKREGDAFRFASNTFRIFDSRPLPEGAKIKDGTSFSQDRRGNWFLNVCIEVPVGPSRELSNGVEIGRASCRERVSSPV